METICLSAFFGFLRSSEFTVSSASSFPATGIHLCDISAISDSHFASKTDQFRHDPVFIDSSRSLITRHWFSTHLSTLVSRAGLPPRLYTPHSFLISAATSAARVNINLSLIKNMGHWSYSAVDSYIQSLSSGIVASHSKIASMPRVGASCPLGPPEVFP
ncbi:UNVERIFIED_CONTAM: hypothetical protein FKN15_059846 [Acipenser sinensis]